MIIHLRDLSGDRSPEVEKFIQQVIRIHASSLYGSVRMTRILNEQGIYPTTSALRCVYTEYKLVGTQRKLCDNEIRKPRNDSGKFYIDRKLLAARMKEIFKENPMFGCYDFQRVLREEYGSSPNEHIVRKIIHKEKLIHPDRNPWIRPFRWSEEELAILRAKIILIYDQHGMMGYKPLTGKLQEQGIKVGFQTVHMATHHPDVKVIRDKLFEQAEKLKAEKEFERIENSNRWTPERKNKIRPIIIQYRIAEGRTSYRDITVQLNSVNKIKVSEKIVLTILQEPAIRQMTADMFAERARIRREARRGAKTRIQLTVAECNFLRPLIRKLLEQNPVITKPAISLALKEHISRLGPKSVYSILEEEEFRTVRTQARLQANEQREQEKIKAIANKELEATWRKARIMSAMKTQIHANVKMGHREIAHTINHGYKVHVSRQEILRLLKEPEIELAKKEARVQRKILLALKKKMRGKNSRNRPASPMQVTARMITKLSSIRR